MVQGSGLYCRKFFEVIFACMHLVSHLGCTLPQFTSPVTNSFHWNLDPAESWLLKQIQWWVFPHRIVLSCFRFQNFLQQPFQCYDHPDGESWFVLLLFPAPRHLPSLHACGLFRAWMTTQAHSPFPPPFNSSHAEVNDETLVLIIFIHLLKYFKKQNFINFEDWCSILWGGGIGTLCGPFLSAFSCYPINTPVSSPNQPLALLLTCRGL